MKKIFLLLAFSISVAGMAVAQDDSDTFKATSGITADVNFTPFQDNGQVIGLDAINLRWFFQPGYALRLGLHAELFSDKFDNEEPGSANVVAKSSTFLLGLHPGIEKHFEGTSRLSPYIGAEVFFDNFSSRASAASQGVDFYEIRGATDDGDSGFPNRAYTELGLGIFAGADYYFSKNIFFGAEFGYGLSYFIYGTVEETVNNTTVELTSGKQHELSLGSNARAALKLGWKF